MTLEDMFNDLCNATTKDKDNNIDTTDYSLSESEQVIYNTLVNLANNKTIPILISITALKELTGLSKSTITKGISNLVYYNYIYKLDTSYGNIYSFNEIDSNKTVINANIII